MADIKWNYKPNVKKHLFETAHSGFYSGEQSGTVVNLLPKTWTKYTVTDGDWKEEYTIEPLVKRDIYLANMIDDIDLHKKSLYKEGNHIRINNETNTISLYPYDAEYTFTNGVLFDEDRLYVYSDVPPKLGGVINKLYVDSGGLKYLHRNAVDYEVYNTTITGVIEASGILDTGATEFPMGKNVVVVTSANFEYNDDVYSGSSAEGYYYSANYDPNRPPDETYHHIDPMSAHTDNDSFSNIFDPTDQRAFYAVSSESEIILEGGKNYIQKNGPVNMIPTGVFYIYD